MITKKNHRSSHILLNGCWKTMIEIDHTITHRDTDTVFCHEVTFGPLKRVGLKKRVEMLRLTK